MSILKASSGIKVANVPAYSPYSVAEHAAALLLALNRKIILGQNLCKWATTVWIIWLVLTCMENSGDYWNR
jgi:lactate dehydrogenase-like 2-hydroxyacid dehydrogenase